MNFIDGQILTFDKPLGWTSFQLVGKVRWLLCRAIGRKKLKVGHAGTLDPLATGILLVCIGPATRRAQELQDSPKQYVAGVRFGATTPSYDLEKEIDREYPLDGVSEASVGEMLTHFVGPQEQVAPLFSAKSVDGVRAYETARRLLREARAAGRDFDPGDILQSSHITVYGLSLESFVADAPVLMEESCDNRGRINVADISSYHLPLATVRVDCSKGTYIRALARDFGEALGSGAFLGSLRRTRNGGYDISEALSLERALNLFK